MCVCVSGVVLEPGTEPQMLKILKHFGESNTEDIDEVGDFGGGLLVSVDPGDRACKIRKLLTKMGISLKIPYHLYSRVSISIFNVPMYIEFCIYAHVISRFVSMSIYREIRIHENITATTLLDYDNRSHSLLPYSIKIKCICIHSILQVYDACMRRYINAQINCQTYETPQFAVVDMTNP